MTQEDRLEGNPINERESAWSPLASPWFRIFWIASLFSNLGTWVHDVGAGWLMTSLDSSPEMVSSVRVAMSIPMVLLAIPAGVLADRVQRRTLLFLTQAMLLMTTTSLAALTYLGAINAWMLLWFTAAMGFGMVFHVLGWQSTIPELVPKSQLSRAVALGSISFNLARSVGPAVGGVLIALAGPWIAFGFNAISFAGVLAVLYFWKPASTKQLDPPSYRHSLAEGMVFVANVPSMRNTLIRLTLFMVPASAFWALLPLVAKERLQWQASGFGLLVACFGVGAVISGAILHRVHSLLGIDRTVPFSSVLFGAAFCVMSQTASGILVLATTVAMGATWMITLTTLNSNAQITLPNSLRARGMSCYVTVMAVAMSTGSLIWGQIAGASSVSQSQLIATGLLIGFAILGTRFRLTPGPHRKARSALGDQAIKPS